jgi:hypothetical protein
LAARPSMFIIGRAAKAPCLYGPLSSNVRPHQTRQWCTQREENRTASGPSSRGQEVRAAARRRKALRSPVRRSARVRESSSLRRRLDPVHDCGAPYRGHSHRHQATHADRASLASDREVNTLIAARLRCDLGRQEPRLAPASHGRQRPTPPEVSCTCSRVDPHWCLWQYLGACTHNLPYAPGRH